MPLQLSIQPREYQKAIIETAKNKNTLVVLPTGLGKTLIALYLAIDRIEKYPLKKILFLAPTRPLIDQHLNYFKKYLPELYAEMELFTGSVSPEKRRSLFAQANIIFSTPQCIANDIKKSLYSLQDVSLLIIDEAHRCLKNYDYTKVVSAYKSQAPLEFQRILGLTASPGHEQEKIKQICSHLDIEEIELRSRESEDVLPHIQKLEFNKVEVPFPKEFEEIRVLLKRIFDSKIETLKKMNLLFAPANKITLLQLQSRLASQFSSHNFQIMMGMSYTAQAIKISHALELLETQTLAGLNSYLQSLVQQANEKKSRGVQRLVKSTDFQAALLSIKQLLSEEIEHPKIEELAVLVENEFKSNKNAKIIIFAQFRDTVSLILSRLSKIPDARASIFIGQAMKNNRGMKQKEQKEIIEKFKLGDINTLIATAIGEEGLDIPEVNAVIFYEPIPSAIRKIQRAGRTARLSPGKLIILVTKDTRDVAHHYASYAREKKMHKSIHAIKEELKEKNKIPKLDKFL